MLIEVAQRAAGTFARKLFGDDKIKAVLKRLDRLTQDEERTAVAQTLSVVHRLDLKTDKIERSSFPNSCPFLPEPKVSCRCSVPKRRPTLALSSGPFNKP